MLEMKSADTKKVGEDIEDFLVKAGCETDEDACKVLAGMTWGFIVRVRPGVVGVHLRSDGYKLVMEDGTEVEG